MHIQTADHGTSNGRSFTVESATTTSAVIHWHDTGRRGILTAATDHEMTMRPDGTALDLNNPAHQQYMDAMVTLMNDGGNTIDQVKVPHFTYRVATLDGHTYGIESGTRSGGVIIQFASHHAALAWMSTASAR